MLLALGAVLAAAVAAGAGDDEEAEARALLERALEEVADGRHARAVRTYERIVARHPGTEAAAVARRRLEPNAFLGVADVHRSGPSENRVDVVLLPEGYTLDDQEEFDTIAADVPRVFERNETFGEYLSYLNLHRASVVSEEDGIDAFGREYSTAFDARMSEGEQGQVAVDHGLVRAMLDLELPGHDGLAVVLVRKGDHGTGGGGVAAVAARQFPTLIHEFGHAFCGLGDEYTTYTGERGAVDRAPNVSATPDPALVPWAHWLEAEVRGIGVYEGADGRVRGAWKPTSKGCVMSDGEFFCPVCREAIVLRIHDFVDPIDVAEPPPLGATRELRVRRDGDPLTVRVRVLRPRSHALEVSWWLLPEEEMPGAPPWDPTRPARGARAERGPLPPIDAKPLQTRSAKDGEHELEVRPRGLAPGRYTLVCRAVDPAVWRGERVPWVLADPAHLLRSERRWTVVVEE